MARINEIQLGRYNRFFQKLLSMKGGATVNQLVPELQPIFPVFSGVENRYLEAWDRFGFGFVFGQAGIGNLNHIRLRNPAASNVIGVVEHIIVGTTTAGVDTLIVEHGITNPLDTDLGVLTAATLRLDRRGRSANTLVLSASAVPLSQVGTIKMIASLAVSSSMNMINDENQEITILPGDSLQIRNNLANIALVASLMWRERHLEESERT